MTDACADGHCVTCSDEGVAMRVVEAAADGLALCAGEDGAGTTVRDRPRRSGRPRRRAARARRHGDRTARGGRRVKFVDEFRDAELGRVLAGEIVGVVEPGRHYKVMEVCGGHTHTIYKYGVDDLLPENVELRPRPGLSGLRHPDGPGRRRDRGGDAAGRRLHLLRRHDARAGERRNAARREGRGRGHPHGLLAARRPSHRAREP